jgi:hypothetical protein
MPKRSHNGSSITRIVTIQLWNDYFLIPNLTVLNPSALPIAPQQSLLIIKDKTIDPLQILIRHMIPSIQELAVYPRKEWSQLLLLILCLT